METVTTKSHNNLMTLPKALETELSADLIDTHLELIRIIKRYEYSAGWTLLIAPEKLPDRNIMASCSVKLDKVLTIRKKYCRSAFEIAKQAIAFENCAVLVIWDDVINGVELANIREMAHQHGTALYLLNAKLAGYNPSQYQKLM